MSYLCSPAKSFQHCWTIQYVLTKLVCCRFRGSKVDTNQHLMKLITGCLQKALHRTQKFILWTKTRHPKHSSCIWGLLVTFVTFIKFCYVQTYPRFVSPLPCINELLGLKRSYIEYHTVFTYIQCQLENFVLVWLWKFRISDYCNKPKIIKQGNKWIGKYVGS